VVQLHFKGHRCLIFLRLQVLQASGHLKNINVQNRVAIGLRSRYWLTTLLLRVALVVALVVTPLAAVEVVQVVIELTQTFRLRRGLPTQ
jgi:hypothetical protein